ncbi:MAG: glycosyltransferase [Candidatus Saccharibacteria bacterium]|nr:glycosyltransferase [Candidatus Saccharibacteria bacterium]
MNNQKNILQVVFKMNRGGAETFLMNILRQIDVDKYQFYFLCHGDNKFDYQDEIEKLGGKIIRIRYTKNIFRLIKELRQVIKAYKINIIHSHIQLASVYSIIAARLEKVPQRIVHSHSAAAGKTGGLVYLVYEALAKKIIGLLATDLVACGEDAGKYLFGKKQFRIINNGIDLTNFMFDQQKREVFRKKNTLPRDALIIGMAARLETVKNHQFAIEVFEKYRQLNPSARLVFAGQGSLRKELEQLVTIKDLTKEVIFLGMVTNMSDLYSALDLLIMPSFIEGMPVSLIEAQANSLPCLVSNKVDKKSKLGQYVDFLPIELSSVDQWVNAIEERTSMKRHHDAESFAKIAKSGYDIGDTVKEIITLYER